MTERLSTELERSHAWVLCEKGRALPERAVNRKALVRVLDFVAVAPFWGLDAGMGRATWELRTGFAIVLIDAAVGLRPFPSAVGNILGGLPWVSSRGHAQQYSYSYLRECGERTFLRRMACVKSDIDNRGGWWQCLRALPVCSVNGDFVGQMRYIGKGVQRLLNGAKYHGAVIQRDAVQAPVLARVK